MQGLRAAKHRGHRLNRRAHDVVVGILLGERPARRLTMRSQHTAFGIGGAKLLDDLCPQQPCGPHLGDFHIEIHADAPKETEARSKVIDLKAGRNGGLNVLFAIG